MLLELGLRNFKAFGEELQTVRLSKLNFIYGPNSGGKSSLIQALLLLKQSRTDQYETDYSIREPKSKLRPRGEYVDLGSFLALLHNHDSARNLEISLSYHEFHGLSRRTGRNLSTIQASMQFSPHQVNALSDIVGATYRVVHDGHLLLDGRWNSVDSAGRPGSKHLSIFGVKIPEHLVSISHGCFLPYLYVPGFVRERGVNWAEASAQSEIVELTEKLERISEPEHMRAVTGLDSDVSYDSELDCITYLGPLRSYPERVYAVSRRNRRSTGVRGEFTPDLLQNYPAAAERVNTWFERFKIPYRLEVNTLGEEEIAGEYVSLALVNRGTGTKMTLADVGFGINQLLPVIVEGLSSPMPGTIPFRRSLNEILCVEQPEIHLHPRLQAEIADLMIETCLGERGKQWIVETHSELLIRRIQTRIRQGKLDPSIVSVIYVDPQKSGGSKIEMLRLDEDGEFIDDWPSGFFEESYDEIMAE